MGFKDSKDIPVDSEGPKEHPKWGRLLYVSKWTTTQGHDNVGGLVWGLIIVILTSVLLVQYKVLRRLDELDQEFVIVLLLLVTFLYTLAAFFIVSWAWRIPFRIYEAGFTTPWETSARALLQKEVLVPKESIKAVSWGLYPEITYETPQGKLQTIEVPKNYSKDARYILLALHEIVPDRFEESAAKAISGEPHGEGNSIKSILDLARYRSRQSTLRFGTPEDYERYLEWKKAKGYDKEDERESETFLELGSDEDGVRFTFKSTTDEEQLVDVKDRTVVEVEESPEMAWQGTTILHSISEIENPIGFRAIPTKIAEDRGRPIVEQTADKLRREVSRLRWEAFVESMLLISLIGGLLLPFNLLGLKVVFGFLMYFLFLAIAFRVYVAIHGFGRGIPKEVFENGVEVVNVWGRDIFQPWSVFGRTGKYFNRFTFWRELAYSGERIRRFSPHAGQAKGLVLKTGGRMVVYFEASFPQLDRVEEMAKERVGDPRYFTTQFRDHAVVSFDRVQIFALFLAVIFGWLIGILMAGGGKYVPGTNSVVTVIMLATPLTIFLVTLALGVIPFAYQWNHITLRPRLRWFSWTVIAMLLIYAVAGTVGWDSAWAPQGEVLSTEDPGPSKVPIGVYRDEYVLGRGPIVVHEGESMELYNCTLEFHPDPWGNFGIWVGPGGHLVLEDTKVTVRTFRLGLTFEVHGSANISGSEIQFTSAGKEGTVSDGGLEVYSEDVSISNTTFLNAQGPAIILVDVSITVKDCTFNSSLGPGIRAHGGTPHILRSNFTMCQYGVELVSSDAYIEQCSFYDMNTGIYTQWSEARIKACVFTSLYYGVRHVGSAPEFENCRFDVVLYNVELVSSTFWEFICPVVVIIVTLVAFVVMRYIQRFADKVIMEGRTELSEEDGEEH